MRQYADPENAVPMKRYMRDQFDFLGIKSPQRRSLLREFFAEAGLPPVEELDAIARRLWRLPHREFQYVAIDVLEKRRRRLTPAHVTLCEHLITTKSWWDTVDGLAANVIGSILQSHPAIRDATINQWRLSENLWLRRTTLLFQLKYKEATDWHLLRSIITENLDSSDFFIRKAIGWVLREHSKTDAETVVNFVRTTDLSPLSKREALKWLRNKGRI